jgi:hypothetical protein
MVFGAKSYDTDYRLGWLCFITRSDPVRFMTNMTTRVKKLHDLINPIVQFAEDAGQAENNVDAEDTQYNRRVMVRALFAMIEGTIFFLKQTALATSTIKKDVLTTGELILLQDQTAEINTKGEAKLKTKYIRLQDNLKFTSLILGKLYGITIELRIDRKDWKNFSEAIAIRHRITHPKSTEDFLINDTNLQTIREVSSWFCDLTVHAVMGIHREIVEPRLKAITEDLTQLSKNLTQLSNTAKNSQVEQQIVATITAIEDLATRLRRDNSTLGAPAFPPA